MKPILSFIKFLTYSNLFVSACVAAFTHTTYIVYNLPKENMNIILLMVFCFTFFTYNGQRLFRLSKKLYYMDNISEHLSWVDKHKKGLTIYSILAGATGLVCIFFIHPMSWIGIVIMGIISFFYVVPIFSHHSKSLTLRELPYLKIVLIATVWSITIIWLPLVNAPYRTGLERMELPLAIIQIALFIIAITIPFDIRDLDYDKSTNLKTVPQLIGIKGSLILSSLLLFASGYLVTQLPIANHFMYALIIGIGITLILILLTKKNRKDLFFAGIIEGSVIILYLCVLIADYFFSLEPLCTL